MSRKNSSHWPIRKSCQYQLFATIIVSCSGENSVTSPSDHFLFSYLFFFSPHWHPFPAGNIIQTPNSQTALHCNAAQDTAALPQRSTQEVSTLPSINKWKAKSIFCYLGECFKKNVKFLNFFFYVFGYTGLAASSSKYLSQYSKRAAYALY